MAQVNLGRIGFVNKGSWNSVTNYKLNDVVRYGGSTYAAKRPNAGVAPPTNGTDTDDWFYFVNNSGDYVDKTSNQDITGIKNFKNGITTTKITTSEINGNPIVNDKMTFNVSPIVPTPITGDNSTKVATTAFVKSVVASSGSGSDSTAVKLTGNQTVADIKTFTSSPIVPTPTTGTQAANKAYVDTKQTNLGFTPVQQGGGIGQLNNIVKIGWSGARTKITVDQTDIGNIVMDSDIGANSSLVKTALNASGNAPMYACRA